MRRKAHLTQAKNFNTRYYTQSVRQKWLVNVGITKNKYLPL